MIPGKDVLDELPFPVLIADIGGTNTRFALIESIDSPVERMPDARTADYGSLGDAIAAAVSRRTKLQPRSAILALAGPIAGERIRGSWWAHPRGQEIFALTRAIRDSDEVLVCRLVGGKITYVHRRLWPALVRLAERFPRQRLAQVHELHAASGRHVTREVAFPKWVPAEVSVQASRLTESTALARLGPGCSELLQRERSRGAARVERNRPVG